MAGAHRLQAVERAYPIPSPGRAASCRARRPERDPGWRSGGARPGRPPGFELLRRGRGYLHYGAFDLLWLDGQDLRAQPLWRRQRRLERLIPQSTAALSRIMVVPEDGEALFNAVQRLDLEGIGQAEVGPLRARYNLVQDQKPRVHPKGGWVGAVPEAVTGQDRDSPSSALGRTTDRAA
jgi:hypothetical protein